MGSLKDAVTDAHVESIHTIVETNGQKFLCFTRLSVNSWIICVSDGFDLWRYALDMDDLDTHRVDANVISVEALLTRFRLAFSAGEVQVTQSGVKMILNVSEGSKSLRFELFEAKALEKRTELQTVLFRLAENVTELNTKLDLTTRKLEATVQQKATSAVSAGLFDMDSNSRKKVKKKAPRNAQMSVLNPGSKKRKAAQGVMFD